MAGGGGKVAATRPAMRRSIHSSWSAEKGAMAPAAETAVVSGVAAVVVREDTVDAVPGVVPVVGNAELLGTDGVVMVQRSGEE